MVDCPCRIFGVVATIFFYLVDARGIGACDLSGSFDRIDVGLRHQPPAIRDRRAYRGRITVRAQEAKRADEPLQDQSGARRIDAVHVLAQAGSARHFE